MRSISLVVVLACLFGACQDQEPTIALRSLPNVQYLQFDLSRDTILIGDDGLRLFLPANSFANSDGVEISGLAQVRLLEALHPADQLLLDADGQFPLGLARIEVWQGNEQLQLMKGAQVLVQFPADNQKGQLHLQNGTFKRNGDIKWKKGRTAKHFLIPVDFSTLAFHPREFAQELKDILPFGEFKEYELGLADSLYFSFAGGQMLRLTDNLWHTTYNEALYQPQQAFSNWRYDTESFSVDDHDAIEEAVTNPPEAIEWPLLAEDCGVDPGKVRASKSADFAQTFLATPAFAERLAAILSIGDEGLLDLYLNNLDTDLWEIDRQAADYLRSQEHHQSDVFSAFAVQGLTNTKVGAEYAHLLQETLAQRMSAFEQQLMAKRREIEIELEKENQAIDSLVTVYKDLLWRREQHRMRALTFELTSTGWIWPHPEPLNATDTVAMVHLQVEVTNASEFEECYVYTRFPNIGSIYRLDRLKPNTFVVGSRSQQKMWMLLHKEAGVVAVGYKNGKLYAAEGSYRTGERTALSLKLRRSSRRQFRRLLDPQNSYNDENRIAVDLPFMRTLNAERNRQSSLWEQQYALNLLGAKAYPACNSEPSIAEGRVLFKDNCAACHHTNLRENLTGPALVGVDAEASKMWFIRFTQNSQRMIAQGGDPRSNQLWNEWGPTVMNSFEHTLTVPEISAIYNYIKSQE